MTSSNRISLIAIHRFLASFLIMLSALSATAIAQNPVPLINQPLVPDAIAPGRCARFSGADEADNKMCCPKSEGQHNPTHKQYIAPRRFMAHRNPKSVRALCMKLADWERVFSNNC